MTSTKTPKGTTKRRLKLFFNREARSSAAKQLIRATWLTPGLGAYFAHGRDSLHALFAIVVSWFVLQVCAHVILSLEERKAAPDDKTSGKPVEPKPAALGQADSTAAVTKRIARRQGIRIGDEPPNAK
jgi:hypothetical protein